MKNSLNYRLGLGDYARQRICHAPGLVKSRRRKYQRPRDLAALSQPQRLVRLPHPVAPAAGGVDLANVGRPTDNGGEFITELQPAGSLAGFPAAVTFIGSQHVRIPPAEHTYQSDIETVHRLSENEFYDWETFRRRDFLAKACLYQLYFDLVQPNSIKKIPAHGRPFNNSIPASPSLSACFSPSFSTIISTPEACDVRRYPYKSAEMKFADEFRLRNIPAPMLKEQAGPWKRIDPGPSVQRPG